MINQLIALTALLAAVIPAKPAQPMPEIYRAAVYRCLNQYADKLPDLSYQYAVGHFEQRNDYWLIVSVVGLVPQAPADWDYLQHGVYQANLILEQRANKWACALGNTPEYAATWARMETGQPDTADPDQDVIRLSRAGARGGGSLAAQRTGEPGLAYITTPGSGNYIFPWYKGTAATYGVLGVHDYGSASFPSYLSVDFVSGPYLENGTPNAWYTSSPGVMTVLCSDGTQMGVQVGEFLYLHLQPNSGLYTGRTMQAGNYLGAAITGDNNTTCGYTDQADENYHIHMGFPPWYYLQMENWTLSTQVEEWEHGDGSTVIAGGTLTAEWLTGIEPDYGPGYLYQGEYSGDNFFDWIIGGVMETVFRLAQVTPDHQAMGLATRVIGLAQTAVAVIWTVTATNFDMTLVLWAVTIVLTVEAIRLIMIGWRIAKKIFSPIG